MKVSSRYISGIAALAGALLALGVLSFDVSAQASAPAAKPASSPGEAVFQRACVSCHDMGKITGKRLSPEQWEQVVYRMVSLGVVLTDDEAADVIEYLAKTYPEEEH